MPVDPIVEWVQADGKRYPFYALRPDLTSRTDTLRANCHQVPLSHHIPISVNLRASLLSASRFAARL